MPDKINIEVIGKSTADPKVKEVYTELKRFRSPTERTNWITRDRKGYQGAILNDMWDAKDKEDAKKVGQELIVVNKLNKGIQGNAAIVTQNNPAIIIRPLRFEDPYVATLFGWGIDYVIRKNQGQDVVYDTVERKNIGGLGIFYVFHDSNKGVFGRTIFEDNDPFIWYFDKESRKRDYSDTSLIKAQLRTKKWIHEHYPDLQDKDLVFEQQTALEDAPEKIEDTVTGADNYKIGEERGEPSPDIEGDEKELKEIWEIEYWGLKTVKEDWVIFQENDKDPDAEEIELEQGQTIKEFIDEFNKRKGMKFAKHWPRRVDQRVLRIIVGRTLIKQLDDDGEEVDETINPFGLDSDGDPIVPAVPLISQKTRSAYPTCPTFYALPLNRSLNKRHAQEIYAVSKTLNSPVVMDDGATWTDPKRPDAPGVNLKVSKNAAFPPFRLPPGDVNLANLRSIISQETEDIDDQYDLPEILKGKIPKGFQGQMSGRLGLALQDTALMKANPALRGLESALVRVGKVILAIIIKHWPRQMWERLLKEEDRLTVAPEGSEELKQRQELERQKFQHMMPDGSIMPGGEHPGAVEGSTEAIEGGPEAQEEALSIKIRKKWADALDSIENDGITLIDLDVAVTAGSTLPTNRMAKEDLGIEKYKIGLYDRKAAMEYMDDPKAKEISERMDAKDLLTAQAEAAGKAK